MTPEQSEKGVTWKLPTRNYMFKVNNKNTRIRCEICPKLKIKIPEQHQRHYECRKCFRKVICRNTRTVKVVEQ